MAYEKWLTRGATGMEVWIGFTCRSYSESFSARHFPAVCDKT